MALISLGENQIPIGIEEVLVKCPSCEADNWADIMVICRYFHLYWIPILPVDKDLHIICKKCGLKRYGLPLNSGIIKNYEEIKGKFRHPWFSYIGASIILIFILTVVVFSIV